MSDTIVNVRHAAPAWHLAPRRRHHSLAPVAVETPVRLVELDVGAMRLAYAGPDGPDAFRLGTEEVDAPLYEAEGRLWQVGTCVAGRGERGKGKVGIGWLTGEGSDGSLPWTSLDAFAARTPLSRRAIALADVNEGARVVETYVDEARAGLVALADRDLRLCDGVLYHAFQGVHVGVRCMDWFMQPPRPHAAISTANPRAPFEGGDEFYVVRADKLDAIRMFRAVAGSARGDGPLGDEEMGAKLRLMEGRDCVEDVMATVNALPARMVRLLKGGRIEGRSVSGNMLDLDLGCLRRPMALGSAALIDGISARATVATLEGVVEEALGRNPGIRIRTGLTNVRAYLTHVAAPALAARSYMEPEDAAAMDGIAP